MKLIIGLGNPGNKYQNTKHNAGFIAIDFLAEKYSGKNPKWNDSQKGKLQYLRIEINGETIELIKPQTFMNNSGFSIQYAQKKHNFKPEDIFIIYDDLDIDLGNLKIGFFESAGGHKGVKSIIQHLGFNNFLRFRIGIQTPLSKKIPVDKYVLSRFSLFEKLKLKKVIHKTTEAIELAIEKSPTEAMNKYN
ncbi:aminoacyl-tRNA hydrolase [bacterium]|nr:aminoacyl-tRNA hydrolase [bacterium]